MSKTLTLKPRMSEKAYAQSQTGAYVFDVPGDANKHTVARAVSAQFEVTVTEVNVLTVKGKQKRSVTKRGVRSTGKRPDTKKAYVRLKEGQSLPLFEAIEAEEAKQQETQAKLDKATAKAAEKEAKKAAKEKK